MQATSSDGIQWPSAPEAYTGLVTTDAVCATSWDAKVWMFFAYVVNDSQKVIPGKLLYPEGAVLYPNRAFAHAQWPLPEVDDSDHYPYAVDYAWPVQG